MKGGSGDDILDAGFGNDSIDGGDGTDLLIDDFSGITTAVTLDNTGASIVAPTGTTISNVEAFNVTTGVGNDTIKLKGRFNDTLKTQDGDDIISSGLGYDTIDGGAGNDLLILDYSANNYSGISTSFIVVMVIFMPIIKVEILMIELTLVISRNFKLQGLR